MAETELTRNLVVERLAHRLDAESWKVLLVCSHGEEIQHSAPTIGNQPQLMAIGRLLDMGLIEPKLSAVATSEIAAVKESKAFERIFRYRMTSLGNAVFDFSMGRFGLSLTKKALPGATSGKNADGLASA